jgi:hypothetical protein
VIAFSGYSRASSRLKSRAHAVARLRSGSRKRHPLTLGRTAADSSTFLATCFVIVLIFVLGERLVIVPLERRFERR